MSLEQLGWDIAMIAVFATSISGAARLSPGRDGTGGWAVAVGVSPIASECTCPQRRRTTAPTRLSRSALFLIWAASWAHARSRRRASRIPVTGGFHAWRGMRMRGEKLPGKVAKSVEPLPGTFAHRYPTWPRLYNVGADKSDAWLRLATQPMAEAIELLASRLFHSSGQMSFAP